MEKVYLASGISDKARKQYQKEVAEKIRELGYHVYAAAENDSINDKSNDPTPLDIYNGDIERIKECDIFVVCISGGNEDGTLSEIGMVAGWNEMVEYHNKVRCALSNENIHLMHIEPIKIVAYTSNERLNNPDFSQNISSAGFNHLVLGMIQNWGSFVGDEKDMLKELELMLYE